jgi:hypothetical protein
MINYIFAAILIIHGIIHLMGYSKSFHYSELKNITKPISKPIGVIWISSCLLFIATAVFFLIDKNFWWIIGLTAVTLSQIVIFLSWKDAKFGTIANLIILAFIAWKEFF